MELSRDRLESCQITVDLKTQKKFFNEHSNIYYSILGSYMDKYYELKNLKTIIQSPKMAATLKMISKYLTLLTDAVLAVVALLRSKSEENTEETGIIHGKNCTEANSIIKNTIYDKLQRKLM